MKNLYKLFVVLILVTACSTDLDQAPPNIASSDSLTDFEGVLNAAYWYQTGSVTPLAIMGDFRSDNTRFDESPHDEFDDFDGGVTSMEGDFFRPFYASLYKSILSSNSVIENSFNTTHIGEAKFLRALSYFKLVRVFGDVTINLSGAPSASDQSILPRQPVNSVYSQIVSDLNAAITALDNTGVSLGRASQIAAKALLGKVLLEQGEFSNAASELASVITMASSLGISLKPNFADVFASDLNSEIIFATQLSTSISVSDYSGDGFDVWYSGGNTKADEIPVNLDLINAFDSSDSRRSASIEAGNQVATKYSVLGADQDWIELRLADVILMYSEALNESGSSSSALIELNKIRTRAGLLSLTSTDAAVLRQSIQDERRLELAFEGHRWFDLVRSNSVNAEMGETISSSYYLFPIPTSEIFSSDGIITQNDGY